MKTIFILTFIFLEENHYITSYVFSIIIAALINYVYKTIGSTVYPALRKS